MAGNLIKLYTTFIQTTCLDSIVRLLKNRIQPKLSQIPDYTETSTSNSYIYQTRSGIGVILEALEIYLSLVAPIKFHNFFSSRFRLALR